MRKRNNFDFGREPGDSDEDYARRLSLRWLNLYEAWHMCRSDPKTLMVRYEDFIESPESIASKIRDGIGVAVDPASVTVFPDHVTAGTITGSVGRRSSEPLPEGVLRVFSELLGDELAELHYEESNFLPSRRVYFNDISEVNAQMALV